MSKIVIIGGGPAGSTAAEHLQANGHEVTVLEKDEKGRDKPCGGGVPAMAIEEFPYINEAVMHVTRQLKVEFRGITNVLDEDIYMVERHIFDEMLVERAESEGARVKYRERATVINPTEHYVLTNRGNKYRYDYLVGADGPLSIVGKTVGVKHHLIPLVYAMVESKINGSDTSEIIINDDMNGYFWAFPKANYVNIGLGGTMGGRAINKEITKQIKKRGMKLKYRRGWVIPFDFSNQPAIHKKIILVGDSAGFVNPVTGEGIFYAMKSGSELSKVIDGEMDAADYPSFKPRLLQCQKFKDLIANQSEIEPQLLSTIHSNERLAKSLLEFVYVKSHEKETKPEILGEEEKKERYKAMLKNIPEGA